MANPLQVKKRTGKKWNGLPRKRMKIGKDVTNARKDKVKAKSTEGFWEFVAEGELRKKLAEDETKKPKDQKELKAGAIPGELPPEPTELVSRNYSKT